MFVNKVSLETLRNIYSEIINIEDSIEDELDYQLIYNSIVFEIGDYDKLIEINKKYFWSYLEYKSMVFRGYLYNNQIKEAEQILLEIKNLSAEDIITTMSEIEYNISTKKYDTALELLLNLKEYYGDLPKIINLMVSCYIGKLQITEAKEILLKLYEAFERGVFDYCDNTEFEICLKNLITCLLLTEPKTKSESLSINKLIGKLSEITTEDNLLVKISELNAVFN